MVENNFSYSSTPVTLSSIVSPFGSDGVQLVDEDDGGRLLLRQSERVAHQLGAVTDEHLKGEIKYETKEVVISGFSKQCHRFKKLVVPERAAVRRV